MKITITRDSGIMVVDDEARPVNTTVLPPEIEAVFFNTRRGEGFIQYQETEEEEITDRDLEAERLEEQRRRQNNLKSLEEPIYKKVKIQRRPKTITDFTPYQGLLDEWNAYVPPPVLQPDPEFLAKQEELKQEAEAERISTMGTVQPATLQELSGMSRAELRDWFDANITTEAQLRRVIRWLFIYVIRRL